MIHATNTALHKRPEAFDSIRMAIPAHVNLLRVTNARVLIARWPKHVVNSQFVSVDRGRWQHALDNVRHDVRPRSILNRDGHDFPATLNHSENRNVVRVGAGSACNASLAPATFPADIGFVHFDRRVTFKGFNIFGHEFVTDFLRDAVRGLVGNAKLTLKLLRGDSATSACHEVHRIEPQMKRRGRLMEDRASGRRKVLSASLTRPSLTLLREFKRYEHSQQRQAWTCQACGKHLAPTAGTVFHKSATSLHLWSYPLYLMHITHSDI